jgi:hypothetical protein
VYRRFRVSWTVSSPGASGNKIVRFPEQFDFVSEAEALRYGENRAHTYIDSVLCAASRLQAAEQGAGNASEGLSSL